MTPPSPHFVHRLRVAYPDVDRMGFVHHARYAIYLEAARIELLRATGTSYREWEDRGLFLPVTHLGIDYAKPGLYDDDLEVLLWITQITRLRMGFRYEVRCEARGLTLVTGESRHVFMNKEGRPTRVGPEILDALRAISGGGETVEPGED